MDQDLIFKTDHWPSRSAFVNSCPKGLIWTNSIRRETLKTYLVSGEDGKADAMLPVEAQLALDHQSVRLTPSVVAQDTLSTKN